MWECDPANNYLWTRKTDMPVLVSLPYTTYFSLDNKGYVLYTDNTFWQFDPVLNSWTKKSDFPGPARSLAVSFVLGNYAYMGTGASGTVSYDDIWRYDSSNDTWTLISHIPEARNSSVAFTLNNKAYIGYGWRSGYKIFTDFYEFDPNYPSK
jgi:N-acetylneuraminic acid mutarotase